MSGNILSEEGYKEKLVSGVFERKICRSCLGEVQKDCFWLDGFYLERKVLDMYKNITSIEVDAKDYLPKKLCTTCYDHIIKFDLFKNKVLESEKILAEISTFVAIKMEEKTENDVKEEHDFKYDNDSSSFNEDINSEPSQKNLEPVHIEDSESEPIEDLKKQEDNRTKEVLKVLPKAKIRNRVAKKNLMPIGDDNVENKQKRERRKDTCKECGKVLFAYKMENHMRTHTKEKPYECEKCGALFSEKSNLNRHAKIHGNDRPIKCAICGKGFLRPSSRAMHELTAHKSEKSILCPICARGFKHQYFLNKHMANIHNKTEVSVKVESSGYPCPICGNFYRTKSSLSVHKMKHDQPKAFLCNVCGNAFSTKAVLENHQKVHTGEKNYSCDTCDKKFRFMSSLKTHILVHSGEKPLSCHICNKQFRQHSHLNTHIKGQHSTSRPYQCNFCSKTFKQSCNLTVHTRIHTGETPYHCEVCQKGFYDSSRMKKHKRSHFDKTTIPIKWDNKTGLDDNRIDTNILQT